MSTSGDELVPDSLDAGDPIKESPAGVSKSMSSIAPIKFGSSTQSPVPPSPINEDGESLKSAHSGTQEPLNTGEPPSGIGLRAVYPKTRTLVESSVKEVMSPNPILGSEKQAINERLNSIEKFMEDALPMLQTMSVQLQKQSPPDSPIKGDQEENEEKREFYEQFQPLPPPPPGKPPSWQSAQSAQGEKYKPKSAEQAAPEGPLNGPPPELIAEWTKQWQQTQEEYITYEERPFEGINQEDDRHSLTWSQLPQWQGGTWLQCASSQVVTT